MTRMPTEIAPMMPRVSSPAEPALYARNQTRQRYRVAPGAILTLQLGAGDQLQVIDTEGCQPAELMALDSEGNPALAALALESDPKGEFIAQQRHYPVDFPDAARLWSGDTPAGHSRTLICHQPVTVLLAAPGGKTPVHQQQRASDLCIWHTPAQAADPSTHLPIPLAEVIDEFTLKPGTARAYSVNAGDYIQVIDVAGRQCSDFVAFSQQALIQGQCIELDPTVTRTLNSLAYPGPGLFSKFYDQQMQPMLEVVQDTVGRHDTFALACTARYYESQGYFGHDNCSDNISRELQPYGVAARPGWPAINFFFNTSIDAHQQLQVDEPWSRPGDYVLLRALQDLVCVSTSCPDDIDPANGWQPTDIHIRTYSAKEHFSHAMTTRITADAEPVLTRQSGFYPMLSQMTQQFTDYRGWWLPTQFNHAGRTQEYLACREKVAVMDLSALRKFEVIGPDAEALLDYCLTRDIRKLAIGQVVYSALCYPHGGMLDDGTLLRLGQDNFRWIGGEDYAGIWLREQAERLGMKVWIKSASDQIHNLAVQGPLSRELLKQLIWTPANQPSLESLGWFRFTQGRLDDYNGCPLMVSRTGYTGELGYEIWCHPDDAAQLWQRLWELGEPMGLTPLGLDALDTLRIEAGLIFAGYEFCDQTDPFTAGIGFCVPLKSKQGDFIGREALLERRDHPQHKLVGLQLQGNEPAHHGDPVYQGRAQVGVITSATHSPLLGRCIALCRIDVRYAEPGQSVQIGKLDGLQKRIDAEVCAAIFYDPDKSRVRA